MKFNSKINPQVLAGAVGLLQPFCPDLTVGKLLEGLKSTDNRVKEALTIAEYAKKYKICTMTVRRAIDRGELEIVKVGKRCVRILQNN
jgi:excisionase family DNA binding protein